MKRMNFPGRKNQRRIEAIGRLEMAKESTENKEKIKRLNKAIENTKDKISY